MATASPRKLFVNLPVKNLKRSMEFFRSVGFTFDQQFSDDGAACMVVSEDAYFMLLAESRFRDFTPREICDTGTQTEGIFALSAGSRAEVDALVKRAIYAGGTYAQKPKDFGFMYGWGFFDLDGHHFEVLWLDPARLQRN